MPGRDIIPLQCCRRSCATEGGRSQPITTGSLNTARGAMEGRTRGTWMSTTHAWPQQPLVQFVSHEGEEARKGTASIGWDCPLQRASHSLGGPTHLLPALISAQPSSLPPPPPSVRSLPPSLPPLSLPPCPPDLPSLPPYSPYPPPPYLPCPPPSPYLHTCPGPTPPSLPANPPCPPPPPPSSLLALPASLAPSISPLSSPSCTPATVLLGPHPPFRFGVCASVRWQVQPQG